MISRSALGAGGLALGAAFGTPKGSGPVVDFELQTIRGAFNELKPLFPSQADIIGKILKVADDFDAAYKAKDFSSAETIAANLTSLVSQFTSDIGVGLPPQVKLWLAAASIAIRTIAVLIKGSASNNAPQAKVATVSLINKLASTSAVDAAFAAAKF